MVSIIPVLTTSILSFRSLILNKMEAETVAESLPAADIVDQEWFK